MHKIGWYIDLRIVFTHSFEHEITNLVFNLDSLEKRFGAIVNWVLNNHAATNLYRLSRSANHCLVPPTLSGDRESGRFPTVEDMIHYRT